MKRLTVVLTVAFGLGVATMAGLWGSHSASAGEFGDGLKCYRVKTIGSKLPNNRLIYISDQFEEKNLIVKAPISFCALSDKTGDPIVETAGTDTPDIQDMVCYAIKDAPGQTRFTAAKIETEDQFDTHDLLITKPFALCEPAQKSPTTAPGTGAGGQDLLEDFAFKCYKVRRLENGNDRWEKRELDIVDQFYTDAKEVRLGRPTVFCTQVVEKKDKAKNNHIEHARVLEEPEDFHHASTISATNDRTDPPTECAPSYSHSVWYQFTPPGGDAKVSISTEGSTYDTVLAVYRSVDDHLEEVACSDDYDVYSGFSALEAKLTNGYTYYIMVGSYAGSPAGKLKIDLDVEGVCSSCAGTAISGAVAGKTEAVEVAGNNTPLNLDCYAISQRAPGDIVQTGDQLNAHILQIGRGNMYCTEASKCIVLPEPAGGIIIHNCSD